MVRLAQGDLQGARRVVSEAAAHIDPTTVVANFGNYYELYWMLETPATRPAAPAHTVRVRDDRATWGHRAGADVLAAGRPGARPGLLRLGPWRPSTSGFAATPDDPQSHVFRGVALAYLGRKAEAIAEGEKAVALQPITTDTYLGPYIQHQLVRIYIEAGEPEKALDRLEPLLRMPVLPVAGMAPDRSDVRSAAERTRGSRSWSEGTA